MTSSSARSTAGAIKRLRAALGRFALAAALCFGVFAPLAPAAAATTCVSMGAEAGGVHQRCASASGVFHVWTPSGYDATKPGYTVVFAHGYSDQCGRPSNLDGSDGVSDTWFNTPGAVYIDAYWSALGLAGQFAQGATGGMSNTLFVAPQVPTCSSTSAVKHTDGAAHWSDFGSLIADMDAGGIKRPTGPTALIGHSGAYTTLQSWQNSASYVAHLDTFYSDAGFSSWLSPTQKTHTSTIVLTTDELGQAGGTPGTNHEGASTGILSAISDKVSLTSVPSSASSMDAASQKARVVYITAPLSHMHLVMPGGVLPLVIQRVALAGTAASTTPPAPTPTPSGGASTPAGTPVGDTTLAAPKLEVPIPNVNFSDVVVKDGTVTIPFLAQYVQGIYTFLIGIIGMVAAVMMIIGGFEYITSAGDSGKISAAKKRIVDAIIGVVIAFGSYIILFTINPNLVSFQALQLTGISTIKYGDLMDGPTGLPAPGDAQATAPTPDPVAPPAGSNARTCNSTATCLPFCRAAGCTTVYCPEGDASKCIPSQPAGFEGVTLHIIPNAGSPWSNDCNRSKFPNIPPGAPVKAISGIKNVAANGQSASQLVIDGLTRAGQYIDDHYAGLNLKVSLRNCYRDTRDDFGSQCAIIMRPPPLNDPASRWGKSTWPGPNPHSSGYGCDLWLNMGNEPLSSGKFDTDGPNGAYKKGDSKYNYAKKTLVEALTNSTVGARRLDYEDWHFNWGGWNPSYCIGSACP